MDIEVEMLSKLQNIGKKVTSKGRKEILTSAGMDYWKIKQG